MPNDFEMESITASNRLKSESVAIEPSKPVSKAVHALAVFSGIIGFFIAGQLDALVRVFFLPLLIGVGYYGLQLILGLLFFVTFLVLGTIFGYVWNKGGWKLGLSLGSLVIAIWLLAFLLDIYSSGFTFDQVVSLITVILPVLAGSCLGAYFGASFKQEQQTKVTNFQ